MSWFTENKMALREWMVAHVGDNVHPDDDTTAYALARAACRVFGVWTGFGGCPPRIHALAIAVVAEEVAGE